MFKVNNKDTRTTPSTPCSSVSVNNFEHVIAGWGGEGGGGGYSILNHFKQIFAATSFDELKKCPPYSPAVVWFELVIQEKWLFSRNTCS